MLPAYIGLFFVVLILWQQDKAEDTRNKAENEAALLEQEKDTARNTYSIALIDYGRQLADRQSCINAVIGRNDNRANWELAIDIIHELSDGQSQFADQLQAGVDKNTPRRTVLECPSPPQAPDIPEILLEDLKNGIGTDTTILVD